jgi:radical SAM superfamily enzyme
MTANPTDKLNLPEDPKEITQYNLTFPITTPKELVTTARLLRETYYFYRIPTTWIQIDQQTNHTQTNDTTQNTQNKPNIPQTLIELQEKLEKINDAIYINIPINQQEDITNTLTTLRQHFHIETIPDYLLQLPPLPEPNWNIFT